MFEPTWIAVRHHKKNKNKVGLYRDNGGKKVCRGHKVGFEPTDERPIIIGCWKCEEKNGT